MHRLRIRLIVHNYGHPLPTTKSHPCPCNSVGMRPRTDRHTDAGATNLQGITFVDFVVINGRHAGSPATSDSRLLARPLAVRLFETERVLSFDSANESQHCNLTSAYSNTAIMLPGNSGYPKAFTQWCYFGQCHSADNRRLFNTSQQLLRRP